MGSFPRDIVTELFVGRWVDISADVYDRDPVVITRGRGDEAGGPEPSKYGLTINNRSGNYSPRNPVGLYYGSIGRNAPLRLGIRSVVDTFARTVTDGWGGTDTGQVWTVDSPASGWDVAGGLGTVSVPAANNFKDAYLAGVTYRDVDVAVTATIPINDVTGSWLRFGLWLRGQSTTDNYYAAVEVTTTESVRIGIFHFSGTVIAAYATVVGITHTSTQALRLRCQVEGQTVRAKVWVATGGEPYGWHVTGHSDTITDPGHVGVWAWSSATNTNTYPILYAFDDLAVTIPRVANEATSWPQRWDLSGNDRYVPIEGAGIMQRLGQGTSPVMSPLRRGLLADPDVVAYWHCEDAAGSTSLASGLPGGRAMTIYGSPDLASNSDFAASDPIPTLKSSAWECAIPAHTVVDKTQVRFLLSIPAAGIGADLWICAIGMSGSCRTMLIGVSAAGDLAQVVYAPDGTILYNSGFIAFAVNGSPRWLSAEFSQNGGDVDLNMVTVMPGATSGSQQPGSIIGATCGIPTYVKPNPDALVDNAAVGHISVHRKWSSLFALGSQLAAWDGEKAGARIQRLCGEHGISLSYVGDVADTAAMGPQRSATLLELIGEAADADLGTLYEPRGEIGLAYRTRSSLYNQPATLALNYAGGQVSPPFSPTDDDQLIRNDVTIARDGGSSARAVLETGRVSVLAPPDGGAGRYDHSPPALKVHRDDQLADIARWVLRLGTVDEPRHPAVTCNLATPGVAAGLEPQVLALDIGDRLTVANPPAGQPPDQISQIVHGYTETIGLFEHVITANCAPASPYEVLRFDDGRSKWGSNDSTLSAGVTSTATSWSVATTSGTLWTTSAGQMPISIEIGGETVTVTAISGASSPQTFTVTRSVNGVVKSHSSGAQLRLARRAAIGL